MKDESSNSPSKERTYAVLYNKFGKVLGMTRCEHENSWLSKLDGKHAIESLGDGYPALFSSSPNGLVTIVPDRKGGLIPLITYDSHSANPTDPKQKYTVPVTAAGPIVDFSKVKAVSIAPGGVDILTDTEFLKLRSPARKS